MVTCGKCYHRSYWWQPFCWYCGAMLSKWKMPEIPTDKVDVVLNAPGVKKNG